MQHWRLASSETELLVRRLGWYRTWALSPKNHSQELCLLFGTLGLDVGGAAVARQHSYSQCGISVAPSTAV
eukprot:3876995-Pyramimonas_sp.AAC.1